MAAGFPPSGREHIRDPGLCSSQGCEESGDKLGVPGGSEMYKQLSIVFVMDMNLY